MNSKCPNTRETKRWVKNPLHQFKDHCAEWIKQAEVMHIPPENSNNELAVLGNA